MTLSSIICLTLFGTAGGLYAQSRFDPEAKGSDTVVIFVHGILGDADTWSHKPRWYSQEVIRWNDLISSDQSLENPDTFIFEYDTKRNSLYSISDFATQLKNAIINNNLDSYRSIVFLAHSMGGLVVKDLLTRSSEIPTEIREKTRFVHFFATPSSGASIAELASYVAENLHLAQMLPISEDFNSVDIQNSFLQRIIEEWAPISSNIPSYCAYEKEKTYGAVAVVQFESASHGCNRRIEGIQADHINIVKPVDRDYPSYTAFKAAFLTEVIGKTRPAHATESLADVVAIDTYQYLGSDADPLETNADEIKDIIIQSSTVPSHRIFAIRALRVGWDSSVVRAINPKLAFLHFSTFETENEQCKLDETFEGNTPAACSRLLSAINGILIGSHTQLALYTRTGSACELSQDFFSNAVKKGLLSADLIGRINMIGLRADGRNQQGDKEWFETDATKRAVSFVTETLLFQQEESAGTVWPADICNLQDL